MWGIVGEAWGPGGRCPGSLCQNDQFPFSYVLRCAFQCVFAIGGVVGGFVALDKPKN